MCLLSVFAAFLECDFKHFHSKDNVAIHSNSEIQISLTQLLLHTMQDIIELSFGIVSGSLKANIYLAFNIYFFYYSKTPRSLI